GVSSLAGFAIVRIGPTEAGWPPRGAIDPLRLESAAGVDFAGVGVVRGVAGLAAAAVCRGASSKTPFGRRNFASYAARVAVATGGGATGSRPANGERASAIAAALPVRTRTILAIM